MKKLVAPQSLLCDNADAPSIFKRGGIDRVLIDNDNKRCTINNRFTARAAISVLVLRRNYEKTTRFAETPDYYFCNIYRYGIDFADRSCRQYRQAGNYRKSYGITAKQSDYDCRKNRTGNEGAFILA